MNIVTVLRPRSGRASRVVAGGAVVFLFVTASAWLCGCPSDRTASSRGSAAARFEPSLPAEPVPVAGEHTLWVDVESRGGPCSDRHAREEVTAATPWCTLAPAGLFARPGDTVRVRGGDYSTMQTCERCTAKAVLQVLVGGEPDAWIRYLAEPGERVRIVPSHGAAQGISISVPKDSASSAAVVVPRFIEVAGFEVSGAANNCVEVKRTSDVVLRDLDVSGCASGAVELHETERVALLSSLIHDNSLSGWTSAVDLFLCGGGHVIRGNTIRANRDADERRSEGHGLTMDFCKDRGGALIENNLIYDNDGWCMAIFVSDGATIRNNTCWKNGRKADGSGEISLLGSRHAVYNNILVPSPGGPALSIRERNDDWSSDWSLVFEDHNLMWAPTHQNVVRLADGGATSVEDYRRRNTQGWGLHSIQADPHLDAERGWIPAPDSPVVDAGDTAHGAPLDLLATPRPLDGNADGIAEADIGAYELRPPTPRDANQ